MPVAVQTPPVGFLLDLVNNWAEAVYHDPAPESGRNYPSAALLWQRHAMAIDTSCSDGELNLVADEIYAIFASAPKGRGQKANQLIRSADLRPELRTGELCWQTTGDSTVRALAAASLLRHAKADPTLSRLGVCTAHRCRDAYIDGSQAKTRRFCTERCQTRAKARRRRD